MNEMPSGGEFKTGMVSKLTDIPSAASYMSRIGAEPRSLRKAVIREISGKYWRDLVVITFSKTGEVEAPAESMPTEAEAALIKAEFSAAKWPEPLPTRTNMNPPAEWKGIPDEQWFDFHDEAGLIVMRQLRNKDVDADKKYVPWSYWSDGQWRQMEPGGPLPLWGIDQLKEHTTVFIHEGAKAARAMRRMVEAQTPDQAEKLKNHPWGEELSAAAHIGWIGGALSPHRTDWSILKRLGIKRAYIVSDNDEQGKSAVPAIARQLRVPTFHVQFTDEWPATFDLADEFPKAMFKDGYYIGPSFRDCMHPATWMT